jgi:NDP-sugar pyrophosphorylase family protein
MKAYVLAGGEGTRLRPYTYNTPKPMLMLGGKPILQYVLENLKRSGITDVVITAGYKSEQITSYFGDGRSLGMRIEYSLEKEKMNTAGSILRYKGKENGAFVVVMGDHLTDLDLSAMIKSHKASGALATIALHHSKLPLEFGVAEMKGGAVVGFREKPLLEHFYNTAIYVFEPAIFDHIREKEDFAKDVIPRLIEKGKTVNGFLFEGVWYDIGRVSDYERFVEIFNVVRLSQLK